MSDSQMTQELRSLYEITGDIKDINTVLVQRDRLEKAEKDAERYRWLVDADMLSSPSVDMADAFSKYTGSALDAAIDTAMEASK